MSGRPTRALALAGALCLALTACTSSGPDEETSTAPSEAPDQSPEQGVVQPPGDATTVLPGAGGSLAVAASQAFFAHAPVVVLADDADPTSQLRASSAALALGAPVLLDDDGAALAAELARLEAGWVLAVGDATVETEEGTGSEEATEGADGGDVVVVRAPGDDAALAELLGAAAGDPVPVEPGREVAAVVGLERGAFTPLAGGAETEGAAGGSASPAEDATDAAGDGTGDGSGTDDADAAENLDGDATGGGDGTDGAGAAEDRDAEAHTSEDRDDGPAEQTATAAGGAGPTAAPTAVDGAGETATATADPAGELPATELPDPLTATLALTTGAPEELLAAATARAAGADLALVPGGDPRATSETVSAVSEAAAEHVVGLGAGFGDAETLGWRAATAATGVELPGDGQLVFPGKRYVALYGSPVTSALGVLGEQGTAETVARAEEHARPYADLTEDTVVPALEIIATVASSGAGPDGNYSNEWPAEDLRPLVEAAGEAGQYVVLDLQPGRSSFLEQAQLYAELLELPHVGLALDPEWNLGPDEVHMRQIGSTTAAEVNDVVHWLADFTRERDLPQKLLVLHQFQVRMIQTVPEVDLSRSELAVLVHADGQGGQGAKQDTWRTLHAHGPNIQWWGWKNFYDEDSPMLTPQQTMEQVDPVPHFISYQ